MKVFKAIALIAACSFPFQVFGTFSTPSAHQLMEKANALVSHLSDITLKTKPRLELSEIDSPSPLLTEQKDSVCFITVNARPQAWGAWRYLVNPNDPQSWEASALLGVVHEIGHCLYSEMAKDGLVERNTTLEKEVFADLYMLAVAYSHKDLGNKAALEALIAFRFNTQFSAPTHQTGPYLGAMLRELKAIEQASGGLERSEISGLVLKHFNLFKSQKAHYARAAYKKRQSQGFSRGNN